MDFLPESITRLIDELKELPGIGPKSAQRLAFFLLKAGDARLERLGTAVARVKEGVNVCTVCFSLTTQNPCKICSDEARDRALLCVVENTMDLLTIEKTAEYKGFYHVLQGKLSPLDGVGLDDIRVAELFDRILRKDSPVKELILALNPDLEGDTTSFFIKQKLEVLQNLMISRIARGIPSGAYLEYTDDLTLIRALQGRQRMT